MKQKNRFLRLTKRQAVPMAFGNVRAVLLHYADMAKPIPAVTDGHRVRFAIAAAADRTLVDPRGILPPLQLTRREAAFARLMARKLKP